MLDMFTCPFSIVPQNLKIGFAGSTSDALQIQNIRNISVTLPFLPTVQDKLISISCPLSTTFSEEFSILEGDVTNKYDINQPPIGDVKNLNKSSFIFKIFDPSTGNYKDSSTPFQYISNFGTYDYDPKTGRVIFTARPGLIQTEVDANLDEIFYSIKNETSSSNSLDDLTQEIYRSRVARVFINIPDVSCIPDRPIPVPRYFKINSRLSRSQKNLLIND